MYAYPTTIIIYHFPILFITYSKYTYSLEMVVN